MRGSDREVVDEAGRRIGMTNGMELIAAERQRQMTAEGWTPEHDDTHTHGQLLSAAYCYFWMARDLEKVTTCPFAWPWERSWWKPSDDPVRNLVKAGALIAAEIDRLQRLAGADPQSAEPPVDSVAAIVDAQLAELRPQLIEAGHKYADPQSLSATGEEQK
jgi:hypothetical protein